MGERKGDYQAWWERANVRFMFESIFHPRAVARQIGVAWDDQMAPSGSDQETFPTLSPAKADKLLAQDQMKNNRRDYLNGLANAAKSGDRRALEELSSIAFGGNSSARQAVHEIDGK